MDKKKKREVIILPEFYHSVDQTQDYISRDSVQAAIQFGEEIKEGILKIEKNPFLYPEEPRLETKLGIYRFYLIK